MLQVPAHSIIDNVTVFADDSLFWVYYLIPSSPSIRTDADGRPVFLLVKYALSDQDRQQHAGLPAGGGYMSFDSILSVDTATLTKISAALQSEVDAEWNRRRMSTAIEQASQGVAGTTQPPAVRFDTPTWTKGKVAVDAPQSTTLVTSRVAEGEPSLLGGATAVFNLDLTPAGADFMEQTLVNPNGQGATDLTPIQVAYDLSFWARLPPVRIIVTANSQKVHDYVRTQLEGRGVDWCTTYDYDHTDIQSDTVTATGAITVSIDQGSGSMPAEMLTQLTNYALDLVKQMISSSFFSSSPPPGQASDPTMPDDGTTKKWFRHEFDSTTMNLNLTLEQRSVVQWEVFPQATMESWFHGMSAADLSRFVRKLDLNDPFFENLEVTARAFGDYAGPVQSVTLDLKYGPDGPQQKVAAWAFTDTTPWTWQAALIGTDRSYQYRSTVGWKDHDPAPPSDWVTTTSPVLTLEALAGAVDVTVLAGDVDFTTVAKVEVMLAYEDPAHGVAREEFTVLLTPTQQEANYHRVVYQPVTVPVQYRARFTMTSGSVQEDTAWHDLIGPQLVVNQDTTAVLRVGLLPTGDGWADVARVMVDLHYEDLAHNFVQDDTVPLGGITEFKTWTVSLRDKTLRTYRYKWTASFKNGQLTITDWHSVTDGTDTLPIFVHRPGITVSLVPDAVDFKACPVVQVDCNYAQAGIERHETFVFKDKTTQQWVIDAPEGAPVDYTYQVTYSPGDRDPITSAVAEERSTIVIIPPYKVPGAGKLAIQILGSLVDFTATPIVAIDLTYDDAAHNIHQDGSVTLTAAAPNGSWQVDLKDLTAKQFAYTITYFTPDGVPHRQATVTETVPRIVVARLQPTTH